MTSGRPTAYARPRHDDQRRCCRTDGQARSGSRWRPARSARNRLDARPRRSRRRDHERTRLAELRDLVGLNSFAAFYVVAQAIERLIEVFSPLIPPYGDDAATKQTRALVFGAITFLVGVAVARWTGLLFLQAIGGTKALHDLISILAKS